MKHTKPQVDVLIKVYSDRASSTGVIYRAFLWDRLEATPLYMGDETIDALEQRVIDSLSHKVVKFFHEDD